MAEELYVLKGPGLTLIPATNEDAESISRFKMGEPIRVKVTRARNYQFFKKWWALVGYAYEHWEPPNFPGESKWKNLVPEKNFDRFRKDITILSGHYEAHFRVNGEVRIEAKSISFGRMTEDEFAKLYDATFRVVLKKIMVNYTSDQLTTVIEEITAFA